MAKKVEGYIKLQIPGGKATPAPPVGPALGQHGVNIMQFYKGVQRKNSRIRMEWLFLLLSLFTLTEASASYTKTPPAAVLLKKACRS